MVSYYLNHIGGITCVDRFVNVVRRWENQCRN